MAVITQLQSPRRMEASVDTKIVSVREKGEKGFLKDCMCSQATILRIAWLIFVFQMKCPHGKLVMLTNTVVCAICTRSSLF